MSVQVNLVLMSLLLAAGACNPVNFGTEPACQVCGRPIQKGTHYKVFLRGQDPVDTCCPRCGLRLQQSSNDLARAEAADFETGQRLDAREAVYVENSHIHLCRHQDRALRDQAGEGYALDWDRCLPSLVAFRKRERALEFAGQHGGTIKGYAELTNESPSNRGPGESR